MQAQTSERVVRKNNIQRHRQWKHMLNVVAPGDSSDYPSTKEYPPLELSKLLQLAADAIDESLGGRTRVRTLSKLPKPNSLYPWVCFLNVLPTHLRSPWVFAIVFAKYCYSHAICPEQMLRQLVSAVPMEYIRWPLSVVCRIVFVFLCLCGMKELIYHVGSARAIPPRMWPTISSARVASTLVSGCSPLGATSPKR